MAAVVPDNVKNRHGGTEEVIPTLSVDEQGNYVAPGGGGAGGGDASAANQTTQITAEQAILASVGAVAGAAVITDANGTVQQYLRGLVKRWADALGAGTAAAALRVAFASDTALPAGTNLVGRVKPEGDEYETVAASQTAQSLGATGATGDYIAGVLVIPATTTPGVVILLDNAISISVFVGGASSVSNLVPFFIPLGMTSVSGAWKITTGANVSCIGIGNFT